LKIWSIVPKWIVYLFLYSKLPHMHTVNGRPDAPDSGGNYQKKESKCI